MALNKGQEDLLIDTLALAEENPSKLNKWEEGFIGDYREKYETHGDQTFMSPKQQIILRKIHDKLG